MTTPCRPTGCAASRGAPTSDRGRRSCSTYTEELVAYWHARGVDPTPDLVTTSGSGYDPDITPQDAIAQIPMVSKSTGLSTSSLVSLIANQTQGEQLGFLGSAYIDVCN